MKSLFTLAFAMLISFSFIACGNTDQSKEATDTETNTSKFTADQLAAQQNLWDEVMAIHDEVMPKMGSMHQLTKALKNQWENNTELDASTKEDISIAIQELEAADEGMWDWMHNLKQLKPLRESESHDAILEYLKEQEQSIILVREEMNNSMANAESILEGLVVDS